METWILKTEPSVYSFDNLITDGKTRWDGVKNPVALKNIRTMKKGDCLMIYHTGDQKQIVGLARVISEPYPDPKHPELSAIDIEADRYLKKPVTLVQIKQKASLASFQLVRQGRLSVVPVSETIRDLLFTMAGE